MLMDRIRNTYREFTGQFVAVEPITTVATVRSAANSSSFVRTEMQARRQRRQRRLERGAAHNISGWAVRTW